jgi:hypothetical protein
MKGHDRLNGYESLGDASIGKLTDKSDAKHTHLLSGPKGCSYIMGRGSCPRFGMGEKRTEASSESWSNDSYADMR